MPTIDTSNNDIVSSSTNILTTAGSNSDHPVLASSTNNIANISNQESNSQRKGNGSKTNDVNAVDIHN